MTRYSKKDKIKYLELAINELECTIGSGIDTDDDLATYENAIKYLTELLNKLK